jgi:hypothetical protein
MSKATSKIRPKIPTREEEALPPRDALEDESLPPPSVGRGFACRLPPVVAGRCEGGEMGWGWGLWFHPSHPWKQHERSLLNSGS